MDMRRLFGAMPERDAIQLECGGVELRLPVVQLIGLSCFLSWLLFLLASPALDQLIVVNLSALSLLISGKTLTVLTCVFLLVFCYFVLAKKAAHYLILLGSSLFCVGLLIMGIVVYLLIFPWTAIWCVCLGAATGFLGVLWCYYLSITRTRNAAISYKVMAQSSMIAGMLLLIAFCMVSTYQFLFVILLFVLSLGVNALLLFLTCFSKLKIPDAASMKVSVESFGSSLPIKALSYVFAYALLLSWAFYYVSVYGADGVFVQVGTVVVAASGVALYVIWRRNGIRSYFEESIRLFLPVAVFSFLIYGTFFPNRVCMAAALLSIIMSQLYLQSRMGYAIKIGSRSTGEFNRTVFCTFLTYCYGLLVGALIFDVFFRGDVENGYRIGALIMLCIAIVVVFMGVGRGGYNLQSDAIRKNEDAQTSHDHDKRSYEAACDLFSQEYDLTSRQKEVLLYLGRGRNAHYIQGKLGVSEHTVKSHIYSIYKKADLHSQQDLMAILDRYYPDETPCGLLDEEELGQ